MAKNPARTKVPRKAIGKISSRQGSAIKVCWRNQGLMVAWNMNWPL
jgi:hypothetical protein